FRHRFGWYDNVGFVAAREFEFDVEHGKSPTVGGNQCEFILLEAKKNSIEHVARFVRRNGIRRFAQPVVQFFLANRDDLRILKLRKRRKFFLRQTENLEETLAAADRGSIFSIDVHLNFAGGQLADDVEKPTGRQGGGPLLFDLRFKAPTHPHIEISGGEMNLVAVGLQKDVRKN